MNTIKIDKRLAEEVASIRNRVNKSKTMTAGERYAILNRLAAIERHGRRCAAQLAVGHYRTAAYDARTREDFEVQAKAKKAVFQALLAGQRVDLTRSAEFQLSQMHTAIAQIRRDITRQGLPYQLCDEWFRPEGGRPYKQYWLVQDPLKTPNN